MKYECARCRDLKVVWVDLSEMECPNCSSPIKPSSMSYYELFDELKK